MEMQIESVDISPIDNSTSTLDTQGDGQKMNQRSSLRIQSSNTVLTNVNN